MEGSTLVEGIGDDKADVSSQEEVLYILYEDRMVVLARTRLELAISYRVGVISQIECGTSALCIIRPRACSDNELPCCV